MNINIAIEKYSSAFSNDDKQLKKYLSKCGCLDQYEATKERVDQIQAKIIRNIMDNNLSIDGITLNKIISEFCLLNEPEINKKGIKGLSQYITWYCWHEGYLVT